MNQHFKTDKIHKYGEKISSKIGFHIVEMKGKFPFGELRQTPNDLTQILVRRRAMYSSKTEEEVLERRGCFLQSLRNDFLINFHHWEREQGAIYFYYEYAHLSMQKWILDLGDDILQILKNQMLELANYLNQNLIFFTFDQNCIGLSKNIAVKYFLQEFSVIESRDLSMKIKNLAYNRKKIENYFATFKEIHEQDINSNTFTSMIAAHNSKRIDNEAMLCSITTRESWTPIPHKTSRIANKNASRNKIINQRLEKSKIKTNEILQKLKNIKNLQF